MFIIWGKKTVRRAAGRMPRYCPLCAAVRPARVTIVGEVSHLYYIPLGRITPHGCELTCEGCGVPAWTEENLTQVAQPWRGAPLDDMLAGSPPNVRAALDAREAQRRRAEREPVEPETRAGLISEILLAPEYALVRRSSETHWDRISRNAALGVVAVPLAVLWVASWFLGRKPDGAADWTGAAVAAAIAAGGMVLVLLFVLATDVGRYVRREAIPRLAAALQPLHPAPGEITERLAACRAAGLQVGRRIKPGPLLGAIEQAAMTPAD